MNYERQNNGKNLLDHLLVIGFVSSCTYGGSDLKIEGAYKPAPLTKEK